MDDVFHSLTPREILQLASRLTRSREAAKPRRQEGKKARRQEGKKARSDGKPMPIRDSCLGVQLVSAVGTLPRFDADPRFLNRICSAGLFFHCS